MSAVPYETFFIGLVLAVLYTELTGIYPGGIIVPAYFALSLDRPERLVITLLAAVLALLVYKWLTRFFILFGKRRFLLLILLGAVCGQLLFRLSQGLFPAPDWEYRIIGWVIPGLLANQLERQKYIPTVFSLGTVTVMTYFLALLLVRLGI
jgi:poly-gamma-glutamate biosynthesis protein PgsC/CapC